MITLDFIFALVISFGMSAILFAMTMTLSVVEVSQYITFSSARAHAAANLDAQTQEELARKKYQNLISSTTFSPFFNNGWFEISKPEALEIKSGNTQNAKTQGTFKDEYPSSGGASRPTFTGVRTQFSAKILDLKLPMIGKTDPDEEGFATKIASFIIREPTQTECQDFMKKRFEQINSLDSRYQKYNSKQDSVAMEDNGC